MLNLIRLEIRKNKMMGYIKGILIANLAIIGLMTLIYFADAEEMDFLFTTYDAFFSMIETFVRVTFVIFSSAVMSRLIIDEYKGKTIQLMFMYPISRKRMLTSKLILVVLFAVVTTFLSILFMDGLVILLDRLYNIVEEPLTSAILIQYVVKGLVTAVSAGGISLIPLYFGMKKHSTPATIISAVIIVGLLSGNTNGFTPSNIVAVPIALALAGIAIAYTTIRNVNTKDVI